MFAFFVLFLGCLILPFRADLVFVKNKTSTLTSLVSMFVVGVILFIDIRSTHVFLVVVATQADGSEIRKRMKMTTVGVENYGPVRLLPNRSC